MGQRASWFVRGWKVKAWLAGTPEDCMCQADVKQDHKETTNFLFSSSTPVV